MVELKSSHEQAFYIEIKTTLTLLLPIQKLHPTLLFLSLSFYLADYTSFYFHEMEKIKISKNMTKQTIPERAFQYEKYDPKETTYILRHFKATNYESVRSVVVCKFLCPCIVATRIDI